VLSSGSESRAWFAGTGWFQAGFRVLGLGSVFQGCANYRLLAGFCSGKTERSKSMGLESRAGPIFRPFGREGGRMRPVLEW